MEVTVGTCSLCGGDVKRHQGAWLGVDPPTPRCTGCGARPRMPLIGMSPAPLVDMSPAAGLAEGIRLPLFWPKAWR